MLKQVIQNHLQRMYALVNHGEVDSPEYHAMKKTLTLLMHGRKPTGGTPPVHALPHIALPAASFHDRALPRIALPALPAASFHVHSFDESSDDDESVNALEELPQVLPNTCAPYMKTRLTSSAILKKRKQIRASLFESNALIYRRFARASDAKPPPIDMSSKASKEALKEFKSTPVKNPLDILTDEVIASLIRLYNEVFFRGTLFLVLKRMNARLKVSADPEDMRDTVHLLKEKERPYLGLNTAEEQKEALSIMLDISVRIPTTYCFKHEQGPVIFGVECKDELDCLMVQIEHQLIHVLGFCLGCSKLPSKQKLLLQDSLPHSAQLNTLSRNVFGHKTTNHGSRVWSVPTGSGGTASSNGRAPSCCLLKPIKQRVAEAEPIPIPPVKNLWNHRSDLRRQLKRSGTPVPVVVFVPSLGAWSAGWSLKRVGRFFAHVETTQEECGTDGNRLYLPVNMVHALPYEVSKRPVRTVPVSQGVYGSVPYGTFMVMLPDAEEDLMKHSEEDEDSTMYGMSDEMLMQYMKSLEKGLVMVRLEGAVTERGDSVTILEQDKPVHVTRLMPQELLMHKLFQQKDDE